MHRPEQEAQASPPPISPDLADEIEALNCIYGEDCLTGPIHTTISSAKANKPNQHIFLLHPPDLPQPLTFRIGIPHTYPTSGEAPTVISLSIEGRRPITTEADGGEESTWLALARDIMRNAYEGNGSTAVCLYEFVEGMREILPQPPAAEEDSDSQHTPDRSPSPQNGKCKLTPEDLGWHASQPHLERKSLFIAHAIPLTLPPHTPGAPSPAAMARELINTLIASDKHFQKATHNITAYRLRRDSDGAVFQDNDDDGETAAGARIAHLLSTMDVWNVLVVVSRWYGGIKLGGDRFRIIGKVAREAVVAAVGDGAGEGGKDREKGEGKDKGGKGGKRGKKN